LAKRESESAVEASGYEALVTPRFAAVVLTGVVLLIYVRLFGAAFVEYDDDVHVYANPLLNPPSFANLGQFWAHGYHGLYNPLSFTFWSALAAVARLPTETQSTLGQSITLDPTLFHATNIGLHAANACLCFVLLQKLVKSRVAALAGALIFAVHPLQVESVGWISQLRGLSSGAFALLALILLIRSRGSAEGSRSAHTSLGGAVALTTAAMLCKPSAVVLPLVALAIDRVMLGTTWRRALGTALVLTACVVPLAWVNALVQPTFPEGAARLWQRPFVAGDALAFYIYKTFVPFDLAVEYGRTPREVLSDAWGYARWVLPVALLALAFVKRERHRLAWLGSLLFAIFFLPNLGLIPFAFQAHSTVADRYAYLSMLGAGLVVADVLTTTPWRMGLRAAAGVILLLAIRSFDQSSYWLDNLSFLQHTVEVNENVAFAQNNLANILFRENRPSEAIAHLEKAVASEPDYALAHNNLALALVKEGRLDEAEPHFRKAVELDPKYFKAYESLGALYLRQKRFADAVQSLKRAAALHPEAKAYNDLGIAFMQNGQQSEGLDAFQHAVSSEPSNERYRKNLGTALMQQGRSEEAAQYLPH
jgi:Flp pilus assembly protein TadD